MQNRMQQVERMRQMRQAQQRREPVAIALPVQVNDAARAKMMQVVGASALLAALAALLG